MEGLVWRLDSPREHQFYEDIVQSNRCVTVPASLLAGIASIGVHYKTPVKLSLYSRTLRELCILHVW